ncbi:glycosyltransferase family 1 protein [Candidatus Woesearchaeota archaeon]|nr:MAG: glycosyltransferase family 1 protein [Candidatus Woesearchaeota archaeon]
MLGWEFPPYNQGGLGVACEGLARSLAKKGIDVTFVLPIEIDDDSPQERLKIIGADSKKLRLKAIDSSLYAYADPAEYEIIMRQRKGKKGLIYGKNLFQEVLRFAEKIKEIAKTEEFDVIHAHDWLTYKAGINAKELTNKPLVIHVHATEFDRTGGNGINQGVYEIEKEGMEKADKILTVSNYTKNMIIKYYAADPKKIEVVHNAVAFNDSYFNKQQSPISKENQIVLFLGRITLQKGPDYFLYAAKRVLDVNPNVTFVMAGSGDMHGFIIEKAAQLGIADKFLFTGFLRGKDIDRAYSMADLYVMPSVSEPFGITPLEALRNNTPVIISKQSGVSEVLSHCLKVDFWDIDRMADQILAVLKYQQLKKCMVENGVAEVKTFSWDNSADKCIKAYTSVFSGVQNG